MNTKLELVKKTIGYLEALGIRPSVQRVAVMEYLFEHRIHPTADQVYSDLHQKMPMLSRTTVYNTLKLFAQKGAVLSLDIDHNNVRYDGDTSSHAHFMCTDCGQVFDMPVFDVEKLAKGVSEGFKMVDIQVSYKGVCKYCNEKLKN